jgi:hypothetical protein
MGLFSVYVLLGHGVTIRVACDCPAFWQQARRQVVLPGWAVEESRGEALISVGRLGDNRYAIYESGEEIASGPPASMVMRLASLVHHRVAEFSDELFIHAGVVEYRGRVLLFPGRSHAGKSTLVKTLVDAGCLYYSDEYAVIDEVTGEIAPFLRGIQLRHPTLRVVHPPPERCASPSRRGRLGAVICLNYAAGQTWDVQRSKRSKAVMDLFNNAVSAQRFGPRALDILQRSTTGGSHWRGQRGEVREVLAHLASLTQAW